MRHAKHKKGRDKASATIVLCFCLIALTSIFTIQASIDKINKSAGNLPAAQKIAAETTDDQSTSGSAEEEKQTTSSSSGAADLPVSKTIPTVDSAAEESANEATEISDWLPPVSLSTASILKDYSMDMVIYNQTLDQYMTHPGIDLEAPTGSGVYAIADGTVTAVYEDDAYGTAIEITHGNGFVSKYASLDTASFTETGDTVTQGQQISTMGKTALYESMDPCHLHFEMYKDGELCNPADYIAFQ